MKSKDFDNYSFKAPSSLRSEGEASLSDIPAEPTRSIRPSDIKFRHTRTSVQPARVSIFDRTVNDRITQISDDLEENIKRRLELQGKLERVNAEKRKQEQKNVLLSYNGGAYKESREAGQQFRDVEERADRIDLLIASKPEPQPQQVRTREIQHSKQLLLRDDGEHPRTNQEKILVPIFQTLSAQKTKPFPVYTVPDQIKIQKLLRKTTFPEVPSGSLEGLRKEIEHLFTVHQPHSDIHYLLMVVYFHLQKHMKVRKHFGEIVSFKVYDEKAVWVAAEAEFAMQSHELCLKLTEECMNTLPDKYLPRFVYLKAKSYDQLGNYINSIVCFNQLVKIRPKISEYYLERGLLYHRIGYYKEAKEDFTMYGILNPQAEALVKQKILAEPSETRRKEYIAMLAKMY